MREEEEREQGWEGKGEAAGSRGEGFGRFTPPPILPGTSTGVHYNPLDEIHGALSRDPKSTYQPRCFA